MLARIEGIGARLSRKALVGDSVGYQTHRIYSQPTGIMAAFGLVGIACISPVDNKSSLKTGTAEISDKYEDVDIELISVQNTDTHDMGYDAHAKILFKPKKSEATQERSFLGNAYNRLVEGLDHITVKVAVAKLNRDAC